MYSHKSKAIILGTIFGALGCVLSLTIFAASFVKMQKLPHDLTWIITLFCASLGAFFSGYICLKILRQDGLFNGIICGFVLFLVLVSAGAVACGEHLTLITVYKGIGMVFSGALGGIISVNTQK